MQTTRALEDMDQKVRQLRSPRETAIVSISTRESPISVRSRSVSRAHSFVVTRRRRLASSFEISQAKSMSVHSYKSFGRLAARARIIERSISEVLAGCLAPVD